ncbi:MAG: acetyl-CoA carboxylase carboxyltransferase subunit beta [Chloroflexia bacterium]|nr:acetyl-CoA carboxylase carboxyltransferase subunit beta [Chloroflexia bacterium]
MRGIFGRGGKFRPVTPDDDRPDQQIPDDIWVKCTGCGELIYSKELRQNARVCPKCGFHFRLRARERIFLLADDGSFHERDGAIQPEDPLRFVDAGGPYDAKLARTQLKSGETEALITGRATIQGYPVDLAVCDFEFLGASMGSVYGEKLVRAVERSLRSGDPLLTISASGGARMHEAPFSLMQMAKTVSALARLGRAGIPHISLLTDPCYGGVTASYTMVADVILAEPGAMIGFAGPRVIEQITKQKLPEGFQTAEFLLGHGMIDGIAERASLRTTLATLLAHYDRARAGRRALSPATRAADLPDAVAAQNGSRPDEILADLFVATTPAEAKR